VDFRVEVSGLQWQRTGDDEPTKGKLLTNPKLSNLLMNKTTKKFDQAEWASFGIVVVQMDDFVKSRDSYFKPKSDGRKARVERRRKWCEFPKDINSLLRFV